MRHQWTYDNIKSFINEHKNLSIKELGKKYNGLVHAVRRNHWEELLEPCRINHHHTLEECLEVCSQYEYTWELKKYRLDIYRYIIDHHLADVCFKDMLTKGNIKKRGIYVCEFSDNTAYIGLTYNFAKRRSQHLTHECSAVYKHSVKSGTTPNFKILHDYVDEQSAKKLENEFIQKYKSEGWNILNVAPAGALGGMKTYKWTLENIIAEAKRFDSYMEWRQECLTTSYSAAKSHGYLQQIKQNLGWKSLKDK